MLFYRLGFAKEPADRIGNLFWRMHRCARITVSLKYHLGEMKPPEMIDYLVAKVGHEKENAVAEVRRYVGGAYGPLYQCGYLIGALQLDALRKELVDGGKLTLQEFHDRILHENAIPITTLRSALLNEPIPFGER
jgi:uncharacterized protein (DUF885 family)